MIGSIYVYRRSVPRVALPAKTCFGADGNVLKPMSVSFVLISMGIPCASRALTSELQKEMGADAGLRVVRSVLALGLLPIGRFIWAHVYQEAGAYQLHAV